MVSIPVIHVVTWITTHLPTPKGWKAELAWLAERTLYPWSGHMSTIDHAYIRESPPAKDRRSNHWATPPTYYTKVLASKDVPSLKPLRHCYSVFSFVFSWINYCEWNPLNLLQIATNIASTLTRFGSRCRIQVLGVDLPLSVVKSLVVHLDVSIFVWYVTALESYVFSF